MSDFWNDDELHKKNDQVKRQISASAKKMTPINVDIDEKSGSFNGSGKVPYVVTLYTCTCSDFTRRKLPCKHMYRLAHELGTLELNEVESSEIVSISSTDKTAKYVDKTSGEIIETISLDVARANIDTLSPNELKIAVDVFYCLTESEMYLIEDDELDAIRHLESLSLCTIKKITVEERLEFYYKDKLVEILRVIDEPAVANLKERCRTTTVYKLLVDNYINELTEMFSNNLVAVKLYGFNNDYGKLLYRARKRLNDNFIETNMCVDCFEEEYKIKLTEKDYISNNSMYILCSECETGKIIKVSTAVVDKLAKREAEKIRMQK